MEKNFIPTDKRQMQKTEKRFLFTNQRSTMVIEFEGIVKYLKQFVWENFIILIRFEFYMDVKSLKVYVFWFI